MHTYVRTCIALLLVKLVKLLHFVAKAVGVVLAIFQLHTGTVHILVAVLE